MSLLSMLGRGIQNVEHAVGGAVKGAENAVANVVHPQQQAPQQIHGDPQPQMRFSPMQPIPQIAGRGMLNSQGQEQWNPIMGGPSIQGAPQQQQSSPIPSFMGNMYANDPTNSQFQGVDPMIFGYPADPTIPNTSDQRVSDQIYNAAGGFHVDPALFGYPADNTVRPAPPGPLRNIVNR